MIRAGLPMVLGAYTGVLVLGFGAAFTVGARTAPLAPARSAPGAAVAMHGEAGMTDHADAHGAGPAAAALPGLAISEAGYTLVPAAATLAIGPRVAFRFTVTGPAGKPVSAYTETHEKELHLIVVRRDLAGFQHVHPARSKDGAWSVALNLSAGGTYRAFADFRPAALDRTLTLGTDVAVAGDYEPAPLPAPAPLATVDGYDVALHGEPVAGQESELTFTVSRDGADVTDLEPYLGAFGHLVSLRTGDLAYLHTHPAQPAEPGQHGGPHVRFATTFPTPSAYRLFLDFQVAGAVRTAAFTVTVAGS